MGLLNDLETRTEQELPQPLQESLRQALAEYPAECGRCGLLMHRHHRYPRSIMTGYIMTGYGEIRLQIPVFRCGQCREMSSGMGLLGAEERYRRYSKKPVI